MSGPVLNPNSYRSCGLISRAYDRRKEVERLMSSLVDIVPSVSSSNLHLSQVLRLAKDSRGLVTSGYRLLACRVLAPLWYCGAKRSPYRLYRLPLTGKSDPKTHSRLEKSQTNQPTAVELPIPRGERVGWASRLTHPYTSPPSTWFLLNPNETSDRTWIPARSQWTTLIMARGPARL